jgi:hypothetical protein
MIINNNNKSSNQGQLRQLGNKSTNNNTSTTTSSYTIWPASATHMASFTNSTASRGGRLGRLE